MPGDHEIRILEQRAGDAGLDHLDRIRAEPPVPGSAGGDEEGVQAGDHHPGRVDPLLHRLVENVGDVGFPGTEMLGRRRLGALLPGRQ